MNQGSDGAMARANEQDAGRILTQNSVLYPLENVQISRILLRARDPGNRGPRQGTANRPCTHRDRPASPDRGTIDLFRIRS
ncbi:hypothetical protein [Burkholderia cenocepacia]|uniref:Uncharacterized protein n=1 Tax=Burkholderia cenocepacia TaxID=95486 RepID=A0A3S9N6N8_9BURK|nr:hypothetical protein [Burkholderia cenocepacia]AZQ51348.1 hypothetical protein D5R55_10200 [Burkholderia cenocepacia]